MQATPLPLRMTMNPATMTGLEIMQAFAAGKIPQIGRASCRERV